MKYSKKNQASKTDIEWLKDTNYQYHYPLLLTTDNDLIQAFKFHRNLKRKPDFIPEPNPIVIYFHVAQQQLENINFSKADLFSELDAKQQRIGKIQDDSYNYYSAASICAIFLFSAIEAFNNLIIPENFEYKRVLNNKTELFNKQQIQKEISFEEKIKKIIPLIKSNSFHQQFTHKYEGIVQLKNLRDNIMHTKTDEKNKPNMYASLFSQLLNFNFTKTILYCKDYINFYDTSQLIEEV